MGQPTKDYTKEKIDHPTPHGKIVVCPRCKRKGAITHYSNGDARIAHIVKRTPIAWMVEDYCYLKKGTSA